MPVVDHVPVLGAQLFAGLLVLQRTGVLGLHAGLGSREPSEGGIPLRPGNHAQAVEGVLVLRVDVGQPLVPIAGLVQLGDLLVRSLMPCVSL